MFVLGTVYYVYLLVQDGRTALMWASEGGHIEIVKSLLLRGADVNIQDKVSSEMTVAS